MPRIAHCADIKEIQMLVCQFCKKDFKSLVGHVKRKHNVSSKEYRKLFPGSVMIIITEKHREKMKKNHWARKPKEQTVHVRASCSRNGTNSMNLINSNGTAFRMPKGYHTEEFKQRMKLLMTGRVYTWQNKIKQTHWSKKNANEARVILEKIVKNGTYRHTKRGYYFSEKMNEKFFFMSSYEERRMKFLDQCDMIKSFSGKHNIWIDYILDGSKHRYYPDLLVEYMNGTIYIEEIKGYYEKSEKDILKENACIEYVKNRQWKYKMLFENDLESCLE